MEIFIYMEMFMYVVLGIMLIACITSVFDLDIPWIFGVIAIIFFVINAYYPLQEKDVDYINLQKEIQALQEEVKALKDSQAEDNSGQIVSNSELKEFAENNEIYIKDEDGEVVRIIVLSE